MKELSEIIQELDATTPEGRVSRVADGFKAIESRLSALETRTKDIELALEREEDYRVEQMGQQD